MAFCAECFNASLEGGQSLVLRTMIHKTQKDQHTLQRDAKGHALLISGAEILAMVDEGRLLSEKFCIWDKPVIPRTGGPGRSEKRGTEDDGDDSDADSTAGIKKRKAEGGAGLQGKDCKVS